MSLIGRQEECVAIDDLVARARHGESGVVVLAGEPGIGKTALLDYAMGSALDLRRTRVSGVRSEMDYAYAALQRAVLPFLEGLDALPASQRDILAIACGMTEGPPPNPHLVSLATLHLLAGESARGPMLICVDDAQWLDRETLGTLAFTGRRLQGEGIVMVMATRSDSADLTALRGLPIRELGGLDQTSALELLRTVVAGPVDLRIADRVVAATGGNPLALTDLGSELSSPQLVGGTMLPEPVPVGRHLEAHYLRQVRGLPPDSQAWLVVAAADGTGHPPYVTQAAAALGLPEEAADAAEREGLVRLLPTVTFRHPLIRSAIYGGATSTDRRRAHRALAAVTLRPADADRRAWHLAEAADDADETVAAELERSAQRAGARGGYVARASVLTRAAELTPDPAERLRRLGAAAASAFTAGALLQAKSLLDLMDAELANTSPTDHRRGATLMLGASVHVGLGDPDSFAVAPAMCLEAAAVFTGNDDALAREALLRACRHAIPAEGLMQGATAADIAAAIARWREADPTVSDPLLDAFAALATQEYDVAVPAVRAAIAMLLAPDTPPELVLEWYILGVTFCMITWDDVSRDALLLRGAELARSGGALWALDSALFGSSMSETIAGRLASADRALVEGHEIRTALGANADVWQVYRHPELLAWRGETEHTRAALEGTAQASAALGIGAMVSIAQIGRMVLELSLGRYAEATTIGRDLVDHDALFVHSRVLPDLVEAAVRSGARPTAERALGALTLRAMASGTPWALGLLARSQSLLRDDREAESSFQRAIGILGDADVPADLARAHLLYGEWLRRQRRRRDARDQLETALGMFEEMGAAGFAERARAELKATGARARQRTVETARDLTAQEDQVARLAALGETNAEIGERLFISARTVDYHLRKVYQKLDIGSRRDLRSRYRDELS